MKSELISNYAKQLGMPTFTRYEDILRIAQENAWGYEEFLSNVMAREITQRRENRLHRLVKQAHFPLPKSLDTFDFKRLKHVSEPAVWQLATGDFIKKQESIIMIGNPGTGKTHLAIGLGRRLCLEGFTVKFYTAAQLVTELAEAQEFHRLTRFESQLTKNDLLIVDELSYLTFSKAHAELLFHVLSLRNERGSVVITTNLEFSRWGELFPDAMLTSALVDRITHHAHILNMNGESYRLAAHLHQHDDSSCVKGVVQT